MIAALYVETDGCYYGLPGVDPWDEARDARTYAGPHPVVAQLPHVTKTAYREMISAADLLRQIMILTSSG